MFDLSECDINNVPSGIYSLCRVFLKESLNLSANNLNSLSGGGSLRDLHQLKILNLSNNAFARLPDDIACLSSLIVSLFEFFIFSSLERCHVTFRS